MREPPRQRDEARVGPAAAGEGGVPPDPEAPRGGSSAGDRGTPPLAPARPLAPPAGLLLDTYAALARDRPGQVALDAGGRTWTWGALWGAALAFAGQARRCGVTRGERVVLALPNDGAFFAAFFGTQLAGGVAVPLYPRSGAGRLLDISEFTESRLLVVPAARRDEVAGAVAGPGRRTAPSEPGPSAGGRPTCPIVAVEEALASAPLALPTAAGADDLALLQFTSGASGDPKGVELTHGNLATNAGQLVAGLAIDGGDRFVSWLPVCHDMGLVLMALVPLALGAPLSLLPADATGLRRWLETLAARRGTFTAAPDFAYRLVRGWAAERAPRPDLGALRVALDAAEPVRAETLAGFERTFGLAGAMTPGYGLAEATVGVTTGCPGRPPRVDERGLVALGRGLPAVALRVVDASGARLPAGEIGALEVASPALCRGYFRNPAASADLFAPDGWLSTGDQGYLDADGELYVAGRTKSLLFLGGLSVAPQEIEEAVDRLPFVRRSAAVGIDRGRLEGEQAFVFAELSPRRRGAADLAELGIRVVEAVYARMGFRPGRVYLLRPGALPLTANGKLRHAALREGHLSGELRRQGGVLFPDY